MSETMTPKAQLEQSKDEETKIGKLSPEEREELFRLDRDALANYTCAMMARLNSASRNNKESIDLNLPEFEKLVKLSDEDRENEILKKVYIAFQDVAEEIENNGEKAEDAEKKYVFYKVKGAENIQKIKDKMQAIFKAFYKN